MSEAKPKLEISLTPKPLWGKCVHDIITETEYSYIERGLSVETSNRCVFCNTISHYIEYQYEYDIPNSIQKLEAVYRVCDMCMFVRHPGWAAKRCTMNEIVQHVIKVLNITEEEFRTHMNNAFDLWPDLNDIKWTQDFSFLNKFYKYSIYEQLRKI